MNEFPYIDVAFDIPINQTFTYLKGDFDAKTGMRAKFPFGKREISGYILAEKAEAPQNIDAAQLKTIKKLIDKTPVFGQEEIDLAYWLSDFYLCSIGEAISAMIPHAQGRKKAADEAEEEETAIDVDDDIATTRPEHLSDEQQAAIEVLCNAGRGSPAPTKRPDGAFYLYGITGSGKTEVFLQAAERYIAAGKTVLYLVPEISLTHQTEDLLNKRFGNLVATAHSALTNAERMAQWKKILSGEAKIVAGPRTAVFAPLKNLGLIIIDEEQDGSYKSNNTPRYHARQVAMHRAQKAGAVLVMGSATPSVESWKLMQEGRIKCLSLSKRLAGGDTPQVYIKNMLGEGSPLSSELKNEIIKTVGQGKQVILFLNRRGFNYFYHCPQCGYEMLCKHCSVPMTYHKHNNGGGLSLCHYCGYTEQPPHVCPQCGSLEAGFTGFGTEMIEEEVKKSFPQFRIGRLDTDSVRGNKKILKNTLLAFKKGEIDILLGTQMVAKGLNFPGVALVGVISADTGLHLPDFRAAERTFGLLVQVAGRAGRFAKGGKVIVQTLRPSEPAIAFACNLSIAEYYSHELKIREMQGFPPYSRLIRFVARSADRERAKAAIIRLGRLLTAGISANAELLGPAECPIAKIAGNYRMQIILRAPSLAPIHRLTKTALQEFGKTKDAQVYLEVDIDPVNAL
ncbi:MAG: primosomal protein N' [Spirochaetaceae bacterium]|jgi:primosomal protein N' (replication factor Y)|nr:primosomal protein N' [Spirochaetaceae bacterium]